MQISVICLLSNLIKLYLSLSQFYLPYSKIYIYILSECMTIFTFFIYAEYKRNVKSMVNKLSLLFCIQFILGSFFISFYISHRTKVYLWSDNWIFFVFLVHVVLSLVPRIYYIRITWISQDGQWMNRGLRLPVYIRYLYLRSHCLD